jgi:hypothetical protein
MKVSTSGFYAWLAPPAWLAPSAGEAAAAPFAMAANHPDDLVGRAYDPTEPDRLWIMDVERHGSRFEPCGDERAPLPARRSGLVKLVAARGVTG